ncbi:MAG: hypothetical protein HN793_15210 [Rhodospirillaceae bacterium]|jgi:hypothetical protein|nr:hypothetical protein [Rhodospirillaceae bacterium]
MKIKTAFRHEMLNRIITKIYTSSRGHRNKRIAKIIRANSLIHKNEQECFSFRSNTYEASDRKGAYPMPINLLDTSLKEEFIVFIGDGNALEEERNFVKGYIQRVMMMTEHLADYLKLMPDSTHPIVQAFKDDLAPGEGVLTEEEIENFLEQNEKYLNLLRNRMTLNLLDAP